MLWLNSQVLGFGSWEEREHGPSHSLGKRCMPSWVVLALPPFAEDCVRTHTYSLVFAPLGKGAHRMPHIYAGTA